MIIYYTDGSCSPNPGPGGFAVIKENSETIIVGHEQLSTNIRMEGRAIATALIDSNGEESQIFTDSEFWVSVVNKWGASWEANGWKKKGGEIKNLDIVQEVIGLFRRSNAQLIWVRGHVGDMSNEMADIWANKAREQNLTGKISY